MRRNRFESTEGRFNTTRYVASHNSWRFSTKFSGKCYQCGTFGHKAQFCRATRYAPRPIAHHQVPKPKCSRCGRFGHALNQCRLNAQNRLNSMVKCWTCGGGGHRAADCKRRITIQQKTIPRKLNAGAQRRVKDEVVPDVLSEVREELNEFVRGLDIGYMAEARREKSWLTFHKSVERVQEYEYKTYNRVTKKSESVELLAKREGVLHSFEEVREVKLEALTAEEKDAEALTTQKLTEARTKAINKPWSALLEDFCKWQRVKARDKGEEELLRVWEERQRWSKAVEEKKKEKTVAEQQPSREGSPPVEVKEARGQPLDTESAVMKRVTTENAWLIKRCEDRANKVSEIRRKFAAEARAEQVRID